jgi:hypothetical protein
LRLQVLERSVWSTVAGKVAVTLPLRPKPELNGESSIERILASDKNMWSGCTVLFQSPHPIMSESDEGKTKLDCPRETKCLGECFHAFGFPLSRGSLELSLALAEATIVRRCPNN